MLNKENLPICYRIARLEEIIQLREFVLIRGTDRDTPYFEGDREENTLHIGAFSDDIVVGCLTFMFSTWENLPAWQLRGMATHPEWRGKNTGRFLLEYAESILKEKSEVRQLWCNARSSAVGFYQKQGWKIVSEEFTIAGVGPHYKMTKWIQ